MWREAKIDVSEGCCHADYRDDWRPVGGRPRLLRFRGSEPQPVDDGRHGAIGRRYEGAVGRRHEGAVGLLHAPWKRPAALHSEPRANALDPLAFPDIRSDAVDIPADAQLVDVHARQSGSESSEDSRGPLAARHTLSVTR